MLFVISQNVPWRTSMLYCHGLLTAVGSTSLQKCTLRDSPGITRGGWYSTGIMLQNNTRCKAPLRGSFCSPAGRSKSYLEPFFFLRFILNKKVGYFSLFQWTLLDYLLLISRIFFCSKERLNKDVYKRSRLCERQKRYISET